MKKIKLNVHQKKVGRILVDMLEHNECATITYGELAIKAAGKIRIAQSMGATLGKISRLCDSECNLPMISAIVCNKKLGKPSPGFYYLYQKLKNDYNTSMDDAIKKEKTKVQKAVKNAEWDKLKPYLE